MSYLIVGESVLVKYNKIWNKIRKRLDIIFHSQSLYDEKYIRTKVETFNGLVNTIKFQKKEYITVAWQ